MSQPAEQNPPGTQAQMTPRPDCGEQSYVGHGRLGPRNRLRGEAAIHEQRIEDPELVAAIVEDARDLGEHLVELREREVAPGGGGGTALSRLLVEAELLALDAHRFGEPLAERVEPQDARLQLAHLHREPVEHQRPRAEAHGPGREDPRPGR